MCLPRPVDKHSVVTIYGVDSSNYPPTLSADVFINVVSCAVIDWHGVGIKSADTIFVESYSSN